MTLRNYLLLGIGSYLAMVAGILAATSGGEKLLAAVIPLALVVPIWIVGRRAWVAQQSDNGQTVGVTPKKALIMVIFGTVLMCTSIWDTTNAYGRADWISVVIKSLMTLFFVWLTLFYAKQVLSESKNHRA